MEIVEASCIYTGINGTYYFTYVFYFKNSIKSEDKDNS